MILYNISLFYYCVNKRALEISWYVACSNNVYIQTQIFPCGILTACYYPHTFHSSLSLRACLSLLLSHTQTHTSEGRWEASLFALPPVWRTCAVSDVKGSIVIESVLAIFIVLDGSGQSLTIQTTGYSITSLLPLLFFLFLTTSVSLSQ